MIEEKLRKELLKEILKNEEKFKHNLNIFFKDFLKKLKENKYQINESLIRELKNFIQSHYKDIAHLIYNAIKISALGYGNLGSDEVKKIFTDIIERKYKDNLKLSDRVWKMSEEVLKGVKEELKKSQIAFKGIDKTVYNIQYEIEKRLGKRFAIITEKKIPKWLKDLEKAGKKLIRGIEARKEWAKALREVEKQLSKLTEKTNISAERHLIKQIIDAVNDGKEALIDNAIKNWIYDRQLYMLKRLARTESANAFHLAQIKSTEKLEEVVGFRWKLSPTHPEPDICDRYATVDYGLGIGVWPKNKVPTQKPHPNCMCYIIPVVR